jgi:hypothetical protein
MFDDMLKKPCPYHKTPVNHTLEQCDLLKRYYSRAAAKDGEAKKDGGDGDAGGFPAVENVFLIFRGATVDMSNSQRKQERHEVLVAEKAPPSFLDWSEDTITFIREDHPNRIPNPGQYPLVVDRERPVLQGADGQGTPDNFRKETLTFEMVGFRGAYYAILGPCYAKFMAVPNYTYLKMKMPRPKGIITVGSSIEHAFDCDVECVEHAEALALGEALVANLEKLVNEDLDSATKHAGSFEATEQTKEAPLDPARTPSRGQGAEGQFHPRLEIVSGARRLSPRQRRHLCVEPLEYAKHPEGGRRALP